MVSLTSGYQQMQAYTDQLEYARMMSGVQQSSVWQIERLSPPPNPSTFKPLTGEHVRWLDKRVSEMCVKL